MQRTIRKLLPVVVLVPFIALGVGSSLFVCPSALGQTCGGGTPDIYNETFDVHKQVDAARYVQQSVMVNNARGDYTVEFTATLAAGRERWTVTFQKDQNFMLIQHVDVDGNRLYSMMIFDGTNEVTIQTPTASMTIGANSSGGDIAAFKTISSQTAANRAVVQEVLDMLLAAMPDPNLYPCLQTCGSYSTCDVECGLAATALAGR